MSIEIRHLPDGSVELVTRMSAQAWAQARGDAPAPRAVPTRPEAFGHSYLLAEAGDGSLWRHKRFADGTD